MHSMNELRLIRATRFELLHVILILKGAKTHAIHHFNSSHALCFFRKFICEQHQKALQSLHSDLRWGRGEWIDGELYFASR